MPLSKPRVSEGWGRGGGARLRPPRPALISLSTHRLEPGPVRWKCPGVAVLAGAGQGGGGRQEQGTGEDAHGERKSAPRLAVGGAPSAQWCVCVLPFPKRVTPGLRRGWFAGKTLSTGQGGVRPRAPTVSERERKEQRELKSDV